MIDNHVISVEHVSSGPNIQQHYQQHFQQHYAAATSSSSNSIEPNLPMPFPQIEQQIQIEPKLQTSQQTQQEHKKTVQTTTTTTIAQPILLTEDQLLNLNQNNSQTFSPNNTTNISSIQPIPIYQANSLHSPEPGIHVEHFPQNKHWSNTDTYLHIFLTFYFGHFAAILFFDGVVRNIGYLSVFGHDHSVFSPFIFILQIILSICLLAFTVWFMTICWRWWRHKSLQPIIDLSRQRLGPKERSLEVHAYVFTAAIILIITFFIYLILGSLDLSFKYGIDQKYGSLRKSFYVIDLGVFIFRIIFWIIGIVATLFLSRDVLYKYCCPGKRIRINKEKPTSIYQIRS
ncbi:unnamed protein product [Brachionus calyciflorus]|uniref:Uncharacterized protein n=1 Tax=Brachionus calyciflorus TaxID=104777 RepID=A0A813PI91_9BILA|nr:unnamed protein product [Brachionus calyciflorus]